MADTMIIQPGQPAAKDTWLFSFSPTLNFGSDIDLWAGFSMSPFSFIYRTLIEFTLPYPLTATNLLSIKLRLWVLTGAASAEDAFLQRCIRHTGYTGEDGAWFEGLATWNQYNNGGPSPFGDWTTAGGDWPLLDDPLDWNLPTVTGPFTINDDVNKTFLAIAIGAIVNRDRQLSLILLRKTEAGVNAEAQFASAYHATAAYHPQLIVTYKPFVRSGRPPMRRRPYENRMGRRPGSWRPSWLAALSA
jgi:hypothetical protein